MSVQRFNVTLNNKSNGEVSGERVARMIAQALLSVEFSHNDIDYPSVVYVAPQTYYMLVDVRKAEDTGVENILVIPVEYTEEDDVEDVIASAVPQGYAVFDTNSCYEDDYSDAVESYASNLAELERSNNASTLEDARLSDSWNYYEISKVGIPNIPMATHIIFEDECNNQDECNSPLLRAYAVELGKADSVDEITSIVSIDSNEYFRLKYNALEVGRDLEHSYKGTYKNESGDEIEFSFKSKFLFNIFGAKVAHAERLGKIPIEHNRYELCFIYDD